MNLPNSSNSPSLIRGRTLSIAGLKANQIVSLREQWQSGHPWRVEDLLANEPKWQGSSDAILDLIYLEVDLRRETGERPALDEYAARFPASAQALSDLFAIDQHLGMHDGTNSPPLDNTIGNPARDASSSFEATRDIRDDVKQTPPSPSPMLSPIGVGKSIGPYELLQELGQGGMGTVYKARHTRLKKIVALKVLAPTAIGDRDAQARFDREMEAVGKIDHPNIVRALDAGEVGGMHYLSMEYVEGVDLRQLIKDRGPLSPVNACKVIRQAAQGLAVAHAAGLVHRDIKPANMLLAKDGRVKLLDLGLARINEPDVTRDLTASGQTFGTPDYMAPEQWEDSHLVDARADLYSLGCTLFFLLTGKAPYATAPTFGAKLKAHFSSPIPDLLSACPKAPPELVAIFQNLMAKLPEERTASARELVAALTPLASDKAKQPAKSPGIEVPSAEATPLAESVPVVATVEPGQTMMPLTERPKLKRKRASPVWIVAAMLLGGAGMTAVIFGIATILTGESGRSMRPEKDTFAKSKSSNASTTTKGEEVEKAIPAEDSKTTTSPNSDDIDYDAERRAAVALLQTAKGVVHLVAKDGSDLGRFTNDRQDLPSQPFRISTVYFENTNPTDDDLASLIGAKGIEKLGFQDSKCQVTGKGLKQLGALPRLRHLKLEGVSLEGHLNELLAEYPALVFLGTVNAAISKHEWETLVDCPKLQTLQVAYNLTDVGLERIANACPQLRELEIYGADVRNLSSLSRLRQLQSITAGASVLDDASFETLKEIPGLRYLGIVSPDEAVLARLKKSNWMPETLAFSEQAEAKLESPELWSTLEQCRSPGEIRIYSDIPGDSDAIRRAGKLKGLRKLHVMKVRDDSKRFRNFTPSDIAALRYARPDMELDIDGHQYPALIDWPGKFEGNPHVAPWPSEAPSPAIVPFSPEQAAAHQFAWAKHAGVDVEIQNSVGMKLRLVPPGECITEFEAQPHTLFALERADRPYYLGATEVTIGEFKKFVEATGYVTEAEKYHIGYRSESGSRLHSPESNWRSPGRPTRDDQPVTFVSPADAVAFCHWLSEQEPGAGRYRLPTEAEWRLAFRGGAEGKYAFAGTSESLRNFAWIRESLPTDDAWPQPVANKIANPFGIYDVIGNVSEWYAQVDHLEQAGVVGCPFTTWANDLDIAETLAGTHWVQTDVGFRVLRELKSADQKLPAASPVLVVRGSPLGAQSTVRRPEAIEGIRSWSIEVKDHWTFPFAWSSKGDLMATFGSNMQVRLWDRDGNLISILPGHGGIPFLGTVLAFSPDGKYLASGDISTDPERPAALRIWDTSTGRCTRETHHNARHKLGNWISGLAWSSDSKQIAFASSPEAIQIMEVASGLIRQVPNSRHGWGVAWSPDGKTIALNETQEKCRLADIEGKQEGQYLVASDLNSGEALGHQFEWSPDGKWIAGWNDHRLRIWDALNLGHQKTIDIPDATGKVMFTWSPDSQRIAVPRGGTPPVVVDIESGTIFTDLSRVGRCNQCAWSPDGTELASFDLAESKISVVDSKTGVLIRQGKKCGIGNFKAIVQLSQDVVHASRSAANALREFDAENGTLLTEKKTSGGIAALSSDATWRVFYGKSEVDFIVESIRGDDVPSQIATPSPECKWRFATNNTGLAAVVGKDVLLWDVGKGKARSALNHSQGVIDVQWSPDGLQLASLSADKVLRVWDAAESKLVAEYDKFPYPPQAPGHAPQALAWRSDGQAIWIPMGVRVGQLDLRTGQVDQVKETTTLDHVSSIFLSPDDSRLLVVDGYGWTYFLDRDGSWKQLSQFLGLNVKWTPDSRRFLAWSWPEHPGPGIAYDVANNRRLGTIWPDLPDAHWLCVGPSGHYRGSKGVEELIVYVAQLDDGSHVTLSAQEFAERFGWKNDPAKASLFTVTDE